MPVSDTTHGVFSLQLSGQESAADLAREYWEISTNVHSLVQERIGNWLRGLQWNAKRMSERTTAKKGKFHLLFHVASNV